VDFRCTIIYGTPSMHIAMMKALEFNNFDLNSLRVVCTAGAICPEHLIRQMKENYTVDSVMVINTIHTNDFTYYVM
jgi:acyl-coenzyme A synthetase/AMP-(fatty) acid ligase